MRWQSWVILLIVLVIGFAGGRFLFHGQPSGSMTKPLYWYDPMEPDVHYPGPGTSRMGMELIPKMPGAQENQPGVQIAPNVIHNLGVRLATVERDLLIQEIDTVGYVEPNENKIEHIHTYEEGWIKKLLVKAQGEVVSQDQLLVQFYSPKLNAIQEEYLLALKSNNGSLVEASIHKLQAFRISEQQIARIKETRKINPFIDINSPINGIIATLDVREGMFVKPENEIMSLVDLSSVWMVAQIYEQQAALVKENQSAIATISAFPGKEWKGKVDYIYTDIDPTTRSLKVRFLFDNPNGLLKTNMFANVRIFTAPKDTISIPKEALIRSSHGDRVIVATDSSHFQVRKVQIGVVSSDKVEIRSGLKEGEKVVVSGQFLIDSEANLKASLERMDSKDQP